MNLEGIFQGVVEGNAQGVYRGVLEALNDGASPSTLLLDCLIPAMGEVRERFKRGVCSVPELLVAAHALAAGIAALQPRAVRAGR